MHIVESLTVLITRLDILVVLKKVAWGPLNLIKLNNSLKLLLLIILTIIFINKN